VTNWNIQDPRPGIQLEDVDRISIRAMMILARKQGTEFVQENAIRLSGPIQMMEGLEYHHDAFLRLIAKPQAGDFSAEKDIIHEVIAYLNRMGQFYYFAKSDFVSRILGSTPSIIEIEKLSPLRMKNAAHRSYDAPRKEDTPDLMLYQAYGMTGVQFSKNRDPSDPYQLGIDDVSARWRKSFQGVQIPLVDSTVEFYLEVDHPKIINEAFDIFSRVLDVA
jgi:hypothetical protein